MKRPRWHYVISSTSLVNRTSSQSGQRGDNFNHYGKLYTALGLCQYSVQHFRSQKKPDDLCRLCVEVSTFWFSDYLEPVVMITLANCSILFLLPTYSVLYYL